MKNIFVYDESENVRGIFPEVIMSGNRAVTVYGVKEIADYSPQRVRLVCKELTLEILGDSLSICCYGTQQISLCGSIFSLSFSS